MDSSWSAEVAATSHLYGWYLKGWNAFARRELQGKAESHRPDWARSDRLKALYDRVHNARLHRFHVRRGEAGRFLWCDDCKAASK